MTVLADVVAVVRTDLKDPSPGTLWTDADLTRAIGRAVAEYSRAAPRERKTTVTLTAGSRDYDLGGLAGLIDVRAVEWPVSQWPPSYRRFGVWASKLTLLVDTAPATGGLDANLFWQSVHTLDAAGSTIPAGDEDTVATGAVAYAALEWASYGINRLNTGGVEVAASYRRLGEERLAAFQAALARLRSRLWVGSLYAPAALERSQTTDPGPGA